MPLIVKTVYSPPTLCILELGIAKGSFSDRSALAALGLARAGAAEGSEGVGGDGEQQREREAVDEPAGPARRVVEERQRRVVQQLRGAGGVGVSL